MSDTVVRTRVEQPEEKTVLPEAPPEVVSDKLSVEDVVEPPFTEYQTIKHKPYTVDYFKIGPLWEDKVGGFQPEIKEIEAYLTERIKQGQLDNTLTAVRSFYKKMEKLSGIEKTERTVVRIAKLAAYIKFLKETDHIKMDSYKYA